MFGRVVAAAATLGFGGTMGFEGPSIYMGAAIGTGLQRRFRRWLDPADMKVLMVAGAAAGVAAIFKAPATGAISAIEVPYQDDTAKRMLFPALVAAATGYTVFVAINGTTPLFPISGSPPFGLGSWPEAPRSDCWPARGPEGRGDGPLGQAVAASCESAGVGGGRGRHHGRAGDRERPDLWQRLDARVGL